MPAVIWALVHDGRIIHIEGEGDIGGGRAPDASSIFRIASMTKSFTAATILLLRDQGLLRLDDLIVDILPWTATIGVRRDWAPITVRDLLTMAAGFPTDDPWGDRQESLPLADFDALIATGLTFCRPPRTGWEYSNLGYALLGRVIATVTGGTYVDVVRSSLLEPLGMSSSGYDPRLLPAEHVAIGHHPHGNELVPEQLITPGAFSPMGGLLSSIADLAIWVGGFQAAWVAETGPDSPAHPLSRSSRREMQEPLRLARTELITDAPSPIAITTCYGYGLAVEERSDHGRFIHHSGGYPGFGSHMRWHPGSGWGVIALGNRTYARMQLMATELLNAVVADSGGSLATTARGHLPCEPWPVTLQAMEAVDDLLDTWDDAQADAWFAMNMDLDQPRALRRAAIAELMTSIGPATRGPVTSRTPAHARWERHGVSGSLAIEILMSPTSPPHIQSLTVTALPAPR